MNRIVRNVLPALAFAVATYASAGSVDCARPAIGTGEAQACKAAGQSVDELRRFLQRTSRIYILYIEDFANAVRAG